MFTNKHGNSYRNYGGEEHEIFEVDFYGNRIFRRYPEQTVKVSIEETYNQLLEKYPEFKKGKSNV